jgi:hypothetical protein
MRKTKDAVRRLHDRYGDPLLTALTIMLAILLFVVGPLQATGAVAVHYFGIAFGLVLLAAIFVVSASPVAVVTIVTAIALVVAATALRLRAPSVVDIYLDAAAWMIAGLTLCIVVARAVFAPGKVSYHRVVGAVLLYLNIGLIFVALYCLMALVAPHPFRGLEPLQDNLTIAGNLTYFSFVTLTSVGYGDIVPVHPLVRSMANVEAVIGQLYPATLLARLVTLQLESRNGA